MLELKLLGIPKLILDGGVVPLPSPKIFGLLGYLSVQSEARTRKELLELFWDAGKASNLRFALFKLRDLPGSEDWLETRDKFVQAHVVTDVRQFEDAANEGRFIDALDIWHESEAGTSFLKGLVLEDAAHFMNWLELERIRLDQLYLRALERGITELEHTENLEGATDLAHLLLGKDKLNETAHRAVMRLEHRRGNTETALAQFETCRQILKDELGVEPLAETLELLREIEGSGVSSGKNAILVNSSEEVPARPEKLVGRTDLVSDTLAALEEHRRVLLHGFGGTGKTALAATIAEVYLSDRHDKVLWLQAGNDPPETLFDALARAFKAQQKLSQAKDAEKTNTIKELLNKHKISLFVLDDVWNAYALSKVIEAVPKNIPLLITSRQRYPKIKRLDVGRLEREDGLGLLSHHARADLSTDADADKLCETLGDHAFALRIAGINLAVEKQTPAQLLKRITDAPHRMKTPSDFAEGDRESVTALLTASLNALPEEAYEAFMGFGALFTSSSTPELLSLCTRRSEEETEEALFTLQKRGLAERFSEPGSDVVTYRVHDLAYSFAKMNNHFRLIAAQQACKTFLERHQQDFDVLDADITNVLGAAQSAGEGSTLLIDIMQMLVVGNAAYYLARGHSPTSFRLLKSAAEAAKASNDLEAAHYLIARLGDGYRELSGDLVAALEAFQEALRLANQYGDAQREITMLILIGTTLSQQGKSDAESYLLQALQLARENCDDISSCHALINLGCLKIYERHYAASREFFQDALNVLGSLAVDPSSEQGEMERLHFFTHLNLGEAQRKLGDFPAALHSRHQALDLAEKCDNEIWMAYAHQELGETYHDAGQSRRSQAHFIEALSLYKRNNAHAAREALVAFMKQAQYFTESRIKNPEGAAYAET